MGILKACSMDPSVFSGVGIVIVDEAHLVSQACFSGILLNLHPHYLIGMTATPWRSDGLEKLFIPYFGDSFINRHEIKNFTVIKYKTHFRPKKAYSIVKGRSTLDWSSMINSLAYNSERQECIVNLVKNHVKNHRIMVLSDRIGQNEALLKSLEDQKIDVDWLYGKKKKHREDCKVLIAGTKKAGVGFNDPTLTMLIMVSDTKDVAQFEGRIRTINNIVYHFVDDDPTMEKHWDYCESWYLHRGATLRVEFTKNEDTTTMKRYLPPNKQ